MDSISGFFNLPEADDLSKTGRLTLLYESAGGYSQVWRGEKAGRFLTYKSLKEEYRGDPLHESLLRKEFDILFRLDHPGVCRCYDFRRHPEIGNAIEMEWVDGVTLTEYAGSSRPSTKDRRRIVGEICDALEYVHRHQVIHRDLKPSNILITHKGAYVKIIDFGLSDTDSHSTLKAAAGTKEYAAPELLAVASATAQPPVDARSDIYSLGKIIADLLPRERRVIRKCTAADPSKRYSDALQVKKALHSGTLRTAIITLLAVAAAVAVTLFATGILPLPHSAPADAVEQEVQTVEQEVETGEQGVQTGGGMQGDVLPEVKSDSKTKAGGVKPADRKAAGKGEAAGKGRKNGNEEAVGKGEAAVDDGRSAIDSEDLDALFNQATQIITGGQSQQ